MVTGTLFVWVVLGVLCVMLSGGLVGFAGLVIFGACAGVRGLLVGVAGAWAAVEVLAGLVRSRSFPFCAVVAAAGEGRHLGLVAGCVG
jgi:hypothetical protein